MQPFVLTTDEIAKYDIQYIGKEKLDEIDCYQFSVKPKKMVKGERYFEGDIWVDDRDLQIVKTFGKGVGLLKKSDDNQFPRFETYREQIDGKYWFPTYTRANDTLHFRDIEPAHPHDREIRELQAIRLRNQRHVRRRSHGHQK